MSPFIIYCIKKKHTVTALQRNEIHLPYLQRYGLYDIQTDD